MLLDRVKVPLERGTVGERAEWDGERWSMEDRTEEEGEGVKRRIRDTLGRGVMVRLTSLSILLLFSTKPEVRSESRW